MNHNTKAYEELLEDLRAIPSQERTIEQQTILVNSARITLLISALKKILWAGTIGLVLVLGYLFWQSYDGRVRFVEQARGTCIPRIFNTAEDAEELDRHAENWSNAAAARRKDGDTDVANIYARNSTADTEAANRKRNRLDGARYKVVTQRTRTRLPDGKFMNQPTPQARDEVEAACYRTWPDASPWPWAE